MIYDCFTFFNELDLLELRLATLGGVVDKFVIVESTRTHTNRPKPLYFAENAGRFAKHAEKIIHLVVDDFPDSPDAWILERFQRDCVARGLIGADPADTVLISDLDEIPDPDRVAALGRLDSIAVFEQYNCYYFLNCTNGYWHGTRALPARMLAASSPSRVRLSSGAVIPAGGWHFSFLGGADAILNKLRAFAHQEYNTAHYADADRVDAAIATGADLFSRSSTRAKRLEPNRLPRPVQIDREKYRAHLAADIVGKPLFSDGRHRTCDPSALAEAFQHTRAISGRVIALGCGDGRITHGLARESCPDIVRAIGTWNAKAYRAFLRNMFVLTRGNFQAHRIRSDEYILSDSSPVKFCFFDTDGDHESFKSDLARILPLLVPGAILCGGDFRNGRRAVEELLPGHRADGDFWWWRRGAPTPPPGGPAVRFWRRFGPKQWKRRLGDALKSGDSEILVAVRNWWWRRRARGRMRARGLEEAARGVLS